MKRKFWNWVRNERERTLFLNGEISDETWYGDEVTPKLFKDELLSGEGDITVWINSPGGDVFAAAQIYNMLMDYKGNVTVKIDGLAASAASVIAMAGTKVLSVFVIWWLLRFGFLSCAFRSLFGKCSGIFQLRHRTVHKIQIATFLFR